jgi:predicted nuclease of predicted toxin-antitoxin system
MKFLVDAQLPFRPVGLLRRAGLDTVHTLDLALGNRTPDSVINELSLTQQRVVVTKDTDFFDSFILAGVPWKLLLVTTGNIRNSDPEAILQANLMRIVDGFDQFSFIEINRTSVVFHS